MTRTGVVAPTKLQNLEKKSKFFGKDFLLCGKESCGAEYPLKSMQSVSYIKSTFCGCIIVCVFGYSAPQLSFPKNNIKKN